MRAQVSVSKALNRHSEETLGLDIQIEESKLEKSGQPRAYRRLADTADASEEDAHVAPFNESLPIFGQSQVIRPARRLARPQADKGGEHKAVGMLASSAALRDARRRVSHLVSDLEHQLDVRVLERITPRCQPPA